MTTNITDAAAQLIGAVLNEGLRAEGKRLTDYTLIAKPLDGSGWQFSLERKDDPLATMGNLPEAIPIERVVQILGLASRRQAWTLYRDGKLQGSRVGKRVYITKTSLVKFLNPPSAPR